MKTSVLIPKPGKARNMDLSFHLILFSSFMLKTLEKLVLRYMENMALKTIVSIHSFQHAYMSGRLCESAFHHLVDVEEQEGSFRHLSRHSRCL